MSGGPTKTPISEEETQEIKCETWGPSQDGEGEPFWNNAATGDTLGEPSCFKMEEVVSCAEDKSSIAFLAPPDENENKPDVDVDEGKSNEENNEPSTSAQQEEREPEWPEPGTNRRDHHQEESPQLPADRKSVV